MMMTHSLLLLLCCSFLLNISSFQNMHGSSIRVAKGMNTLTSMNLFQRKKLVPTPATIPTVTIKPTYTIAGLFSVLSATSFLLFHSLFASIPIALVSLLLFVQTGRVRFVLDSEALEVMVDKGEEKLGQSGENFAVGGRNRWNYASFNEWNFIPSKNLPVFMYFTETQTPSSTGKPVFHLFPIIMDGQELYNEMVTRVGPAGKNV